MKSASRVAAEAAPPQATLLTTPVERRVLADSVLLRGSVEAATTVELGATAPAGSDLVVTQAPLAAGAEVVPGAVLVELSGRPVIALRGLIPMYRDLRPGDHGRDVEQLQSALVELGLGPVDPGSVYGPLTAKGVKRLYEGGGYEPQIVTPPGLESKAEEVATARADVSTSIARNDQAAYDAAWSRLQRSQRELADLRTKAGEMIPKSEALFLPAFPGRIKAPGVRVGQRPEKVVLSVLSGDVVVRATAMPADRRRLEVGATARLEIRGMDRRVLGTISAIEATTEQGTGQDSLLTVTPKEPLGAEHLGSDAVLRVDTVSTDREVLVVPLAAVFSRPDGSTNVSRVSPSGEIVTVPVRAGLSAAGFVEVDSEAGALKEGDRVVISDTGGPARR